MTDEKKDVGAWADERISDFSPAVGQKSSRKSNLYQLRFGESSGLVTNAADLLFLIGASELPSFSNKLEFSGQESLERLEVNGPEMQAMH